MSSSTAAASTVHHRHIGYTVELVIYSISSFCLILTFLTQLLVYRFTPRRKWNRAKVQLLSLTFLSLICLVTKDLDSNSVFGIIPFTLSHALALQFTAILMHSGALVLLNAFRSLAILLHRPIPRHVEAILFTTTTIYHLVATGVGIYVFIIYTPDISTHQIYEILAIRDISYDWISMSVLFTAWYALGRLHTLTRAHVRVMEEQQMKTQERIKEAMRGRKGSQSLTTNTRMLTVAPINSPTTLPTPAITAVSSVTAPNLVLQPRPSLIRGTSISRIAELDSAASKLGRFVLFASCVIIASVTPTFISHGDYKPARFFVQDSSIYTFDRALLPTIQNIAAGLLLWFSWTSPRVWWDSQFPFWHTLIYGLPACECAGGGSQMQALRKYPTHHQHHHGATNRVADIALIVQQPPTDFLQRVPSLPPLILPPHLLPPLRAPSIPLPPLHEDCDDAPPAFVAVDVAPV